MRWAPIVIIAAAPLIMLRNTLRPISDPDTFWHLSAGEYLWTTWQFSGPAPTPTSATRPWTLHEWAPELLMAAAARVGGLPAVALLQALAASALLWALYVACRLHTRPLPSAVAATVAWLGASASIAPRPQMVSFILLALVTSVWLRTARDGRARWWLVPLTFVWACSHGLWVAGVLVGLGVVVGCLLDGRVNRREAGRLLLVPVLSIVAAAVTPVGPGLLLSPLEVRGYSKYVTEWAPASLAQPAFLATMVLSVIVVLGWTRRSTTAPWAHLSVWGLALVWTLLYARTVALGAVMLAPLASMTLQGLPTSGPHPVRLKAERGVVLAGAALTVCIGLAMTPGISTNAARMPVQLDSQLSALPADTVVFNEYSLGGWLLWTHPNVEPVIDGRTEIYPLPYVDAYQSALTAQQGWQGTVETSGATVALLPTQGALADALVHQERWTSVAEDAGYVLLRKP